MLLDVISVIISGVCAVGSFISFLLAQKEKREAKESEAQAKIYAENANQANVTMNQLYQELLKDIAHRRSIESRDALKNEVISFIACNAPVKTARIADHINLSKDETFDLLYEMTFVDRTISCGGRCVKEKIDDVFWTRRS